MRGIRAAIQLACLGAAGAAAAAAGCHYASPGEYVAPGGEEAPPPEDGPPDASPDVYMPACLTADTYAARPGTERRYRALTEGVTYDTAIDRCAADGAHLAVIDDVQENAYVQSLLGGSGEGWVGFDDLTQEGMFKWVTGAAGYNHYMGGEPNNVANEDCTALRASNGTWHDVGCEASHRPICECDPMYRPPPTPMCRAMTEGSFERSGRRVFRGDTPVTWEQAKAACEAIGAHLLVPGDLSENQEMDQSLTGAAYWIGYTDAVTEGTFAWVTGATSSYRNWPGGNVPLDDNLDCAVLQDGGAWGNVACGDLNRYACECDPAPP